MNIEYREQNLPKDARPPIVKRDVFIDGKKVGETETGGWTDNRHWVGLNTGNIHNGVETVCFGAFGNTQDEAVANAVKAGIRLLEINTPIINELAKKFGLLQRKEAATSIRI